MRSVQVTYPAGVEYRSISWMFHEKNSRALLIAPSPAVEIDGIATLTVNTPPLTLDEAAEVILCGSVDKAGTFTPAPGQPVLEGPELTPVCTQCGTRRHTRLYVFSVGAAAPLLLLGASCLDTATDLVGRRERFTYTQRNLDTLLTHPQVAVDRRVEQIANSPRYETVEVLALGISAGRNPGLDAENILALAQEFDRDAQRNFPHREYLLEAEMLRLWLLDEFDGDNDYARNLREAAALPTVPRHLLRLLISAAGVAEDWQREQAARGAGHDLQEGFTQGFLGEPGERLTLTDLFVVGARLLESGSTLVTFRTPQGYQVKWFASQTDLTRGDLVTVTGTVKRHDTFRDEQSTLLTRCKVH